MGLHPKYHQLDIDDESSVARLRDHLKSAYGGFDVLVNNAAILYMSKDEDSKELIAEKARSVLQTNFFNTHRVCNILFPILRPHARVVNVSSAAGHLSQIKEENDAAVALKKQFSSPDLTYEKLYKIIHDFLKYVPYYLCNSANSPA